MTRFKWLTGALVAIVGVAACDDLLTVEDPQRYTDEDLNSALQAVANGVEGAVHEVIDTWVVYQSLLGDTYQHTGTWIGYDETDHGRFQYGTSAMDGTMNSLLRARWFAGSAEERLNEQLENAGSSPLMAQVHLGDALADLYIGQAYCEAPAAPGGAAVPDTQILQQAVQKFTKAMGTAQAANEDQYYNAALAGRARANLLLGNYAEAAADASGVPDGFSYDAKYNNASDNWVVLVTTATFNKAAGLREKWWSRVDDDAGGPTLMHDHYYPDEYDPRIPVHFENGVATDNITPHYSQWKYTSTPADIPMLHSDAMRLIEAEHAMRQGQLGAFIGIINTLRANVGLTAIPEVDVVDATVAQEILLNERFAELYMEGQRASDLYRFGLNKQIFEEMNDPERPASGRPVKFSMSDTEALNNPEIEDLLTARCLPVTN
ncbi:MAG: RagB/SusD family nutrient uptake outer membrane protein [Gemmatimonadales bacterium]|nr:MAG: RagB/SusD family nutrient uptake outer membrane protein [Gemmatimonadales bacterium]